MHFSSHLQKKDLKIFTQKGVKSFPLGAFRSNSVPLSKSNKSENRLIFISTYRFVDSRDYKSRNTFHLGISYDNWLAYEKEIVKYNL